MMFGDVCTNDLVTLPDVDLWLCMDDLMTLSDDVLWLCLDD